MAMMMKMKAFLQKNWPYILAAAAVVVGVALILAWRTKASGAASKEDMTPATETRKALDQAKTAYESIKKSVMSSVGL